MKNQNMTLNKYLDTKNKSKSPIVKQKNKLSQTFAAKTPLQYQMAAKVQKNTQKLQKQRRKSEAEKHKQRIQHTRFGTTPTSIKSKKRSSAGGASKKMGSKKSRSNSGVKHQSNDIVNLLNQNPTYSGGGQVQNPFSPKQNETSIEMSIEHPNSQTSYVNTTYENNDQPYRQTIQSLGGTGNTSQLQICQKVERLANKYNCEVNADNQLIFDDKGGAPIYSGFSEVTQQKSTLSRGSTISPPDQMKQPRKSRNKVVANGSMQPPSGKSRSGSRSKSNSVSRSIRAFIGLGGGVRKRNNNGGSTTLTSNTGQQTKLVSSKGSLASKKSKKSASVQRQQDEQRAIRYFNDTTIRKYFCMWIERYIHQLKQQQQINKKQMSQVIEKPALSGQKFYTSQQSKTSLQIPRTDTHGSKSSNHHSTVQNQFQNTNDQILFKDASKSSMLISQGFFDNVVSPNSNSAILLVGNYQPGNKNNQQSELKQVNKLDVSTSQPNEKLKYLMEDTSGDTWSNVSGIVGQGVKLKTQNGMNLESMQNIVSYHAYSGEQTAQNCFIGPIAQDNFQTRNLSSITQKSELKETAHLGFEASTLTDEAQRRLKNGLSILKRVNSRRLNHELGVKQKKSLTGSRVKRTTPSKSSKSRSKSKESAAKDRYKMYQAATHGTSSKSRQRTPILKQASAASRTISGMVSLNKSISPQSKQNMKSINVMSSTRKSISRSISRSIDRVSSVTKQDIEHLLKQKHFLLWRQLLVDLKRQKVRSKSKSAAPSTSRSIKLKASMHFKSHMLSQTFQALLQHTLRQKRLNDIGFKIMKQHRLIVISESFMVWIEKFNQQSIERKKLFYASQHWFEKTIRKYFSKWTENLSKQNQYRWFVRQTVPMRCLLRMIQGQVPQEATENLDIGQELFVSTQFFKMKRIHEGRMYDSIQCFKFNLMNSVFQKLKQNYHRMCMFKAKVAIRMAKNCLDCWRFYSGQRKYQCELIRDQRLKLQGNLLGKIMSQWSAHSKYKKFLQESEAYLARMTLKAQKRRVMAAIRDFSHLQNEKGLMRYRARKFLENKALAVYFNALQSYLEHKRQKREKQWELRSHFLKKWRAQLFEAMRSTSKKLQRLHDLGLILKAKTKKQSREKIFKEWFVTSLEVSRCRQHYEANCITQHFAMLKEAVIISQINRYKKLKAESFRLRSLKYNFLVFLKDYQYEREHFRQRKQVLTSQVQQLKLRNQFQGLKDYTARKYKSRILLYQLKSSHCSWMKATVIKALRQNIYNMLKVRSFNIKVQMQFKDFAFQNLKAAAMKQRMLREALIETVQKRNRDKAALYLEQWKVRAIYEHNFKILKKHRIKEFQARRAIQRLVSNKFQNIRIRQIKFQMQNLHKYYFYKKVWAALYQYHISDKVKNMRKALNYRRQYLLAPTFMALKKNSFLKKMHNEIKEITDHRSKRQILNMWMRAVLHKQVQTQTLSYNAKRILSKAFRSLITHSRLSIEYKYNCSKADKFHGRKYFNILKYQREIKHLYKEAKAQQYFEMQSYYAKRLLQNWHRISKKYGSLNQRYQKQIKVTHASLQNKYLKMFVERYRYCKDYRMAKQKHSRKILKEVFFVLKRKAEINIINPKSMKILRDHQSTQHLTMLKHYFNLFKSNRLFQQTFRRQESKALEHLARFLQKKVLDILVIRKENRQKLRQLYQVQKQKTDQRIKERFVKEIVGTYIIEPKLERIAHFAFLKKQVQLFRKKVMYIKGRNEGRNLHEIEVRAFEFLGKNLQRKVFLSLKIHWQNQLLKQQENQMILEYQHRKWFNIWRKNYLLKAQDNYFIPLPQPKQKAVVKQKPLPPLPPTFSQNSHSEFFPRDDSTFQGTATQRMPPRPPSKTFQEDVKPQRQKMFISQNGHNVAEKVHMLSEKIQTRLALSRDSRSGTQTPMSYDEAKNAQMINIKVYQEENPSPAKSSQPRQKHLQQSSSPKKNISGFDLAVRENFATTGNIENEQKSNGQTRSFKNFLLQKLQRSPNDVNANSGSKQSSNELVISNQSNDAEMEHHEYELPPDNIYME